MNYNTMNKNRPNIPLRQDKGKFISIAYRDRSDNDYLYMHQEDKDYIIGWLNRFCIEACSMSASDSTFDVSIWSLITKKDTEFPKSTYFKDVAGEPAVNSYLSYTAGLVANILRNKGHEFTKKQLPHIKICMEIVSKVYANSDLKNKVGWDWRTNEKNELPKRVSFYTA